MKSSLSDWLLRLWSLVVFIFLFAPIAVIVVYSFNSGRVLAHWEGFGFQAYIQASNNTIIKHSVVVSLEVALCSALLSTFLGTLGGIALALRQRGWAMALSTLLALTMITPEIVDGIAFLPWFVTLGVDVGITPLNKGLLRLTLAHTMFSLAVVTFIVRARMAGVDRRLNEAAADLGAHPWQVFRDITLPIAAPGIVAGALMAFTLSLDNTILSSFVQQPGYTPWPVYIFAAVKVALRSEIAAMSTVMLILTLIAIALVGFVLRRAGTSMIDTLTKH
ncbi:ABC transporter permease [Corynebacterium spheniscorum]|uniref:Spermidine/putrescine transport system permease protein n=1 Tax=Corynebacterium spheniscorum TaxID=185761 RepID=A0A1I2PUA8_9CORY|nr:ABC transporter permease [Corynebacterium spheniscorum]KAA8723426.1 ABC transporter permease [Corynebacterium spheniscorum]SFG18963.1 spermidine/putrescine transport system permease protein [Corynebacterium spheniscorum]